MIQKSTSLKYEPSSEPLHISTVEEALGRIDNFEDVGYETSNSELHIQQELWYKSVSKIHIQHGVQCKGGATML